MDNSFENNLIINNAPAIFFILDKHGTFKYLAGKKLFQFSDWKEKIGSSVFDLFESDPVALELAKRALDGETFTANLVFSGVIWEIRASAIKTEDNKIDRVIGFLLDVTQSKRLEIESEQLFKALASSHKRLQIVSERLLDVEETERRKIAYELHDEIGQSLTGLSISIELAMRDAKYSDNLHLKEAKNLSREVLELVREMSLNLRPAMLDDLGLIPTIQWYFGRYKKQTNIQVVFESKIFEERFNTRVETAVYRIIQEALTNIAKHAKSNKVKVVLRKIAEGLFLEITDQGVGFDLDKEINSNYSSGLASIKGRVELINGSLTIQSEIDQGTTIQVLFPKEILNI
jgi:signal transduction histidine kinase